MLKIWRASNGKLEHTLEGPGGGIEWLAWHPRGHIILAGSEDFTSWMWNADSGAFMQARLLSPSSRHWLHLSEQQMITCKIASLGHLFAAQWILVVDQFTGKKLLAYVQSSIYIHTITCTILLTEIKYVFRLGTRVKFIRDPKPCFSASFFSGKSMMSPTCKYSMAQVFTGHSGPVTCGKFTPDGKSIVTGGGEGDHSLRVWDPRSGTCSLALQDEHAYHTAGTPTCPVSQLNS